MSSCSTLPPASSVYTSYLTSTVTSQQVSTVAGSTSTASTAVLVTNCPVAPTDAASGAPPPTCTTSTSYSTFQTVLPGSTTTVYSTGETVVPVYSTSFGPVTTVCAAAPTTATATPTPTTSATPETQQTSAATVTSQQVVVVGASSSTRFLTTTSTFIPSPASSTGQSDSVVSPAVGVLGSTVRSQEMVLSTSYLTLVFTTTDNAGHASTFASSVPTLLNVPKRNAASTNKGAIAGGVVGGGIALILAFVVFILMKKRGYFRKGEDEIEEDAWAPPAHGEYYGTLAGRNRTATGGTLVGGTGGGGSDDEKLGGLDRETDAATLERHQSWYGLGGAGGRAMEEIYRESAQFASRSNSPQGYPGAAEAIGGAAMAYPGVHRSRSDGGFGGQPTRSASNRLSIYSANGGGSSQGHSQEPPSPSYPQQLPAIPDHRLSGFACYPNYPTLPSENYRPASPPQQRPRSASPTASNSYDLPNHSRSNTLSHRLSSNGFAIPAHIRGEAHGPRPSLAAVQGAGGDPSCSNSSSTSPSRGDTSESLPTTSTHLLHSSSYGSTTTSPYSLPQLDRLKLQRPAFERAASTESFVAPTQWLGAKIANADSASESGLESKEDLTEKLQDLPSTGDQNLQVRN